MRIRASEEDVVSANPYSGTLLLDLDTVADAPKFFCLLSLVERAAGRKIVVIDTNPKRKTAELAASFGISFTEVIQWDAPATSEEQAHHRWKVETAKKLTRPVIWVDLAFSNWQGPNLRHLQGIITLDWARARSVGPALKASEA